MTHAWSERLSEYLDGNLDPETTAALAAHLSRCPECATTLVELQQVVARARALDHRAPVRDLWPAVARRIGPRRRRWTLTLSLPELVAAALTLLLVGAGTAWWLGRAEPPLAAPPDAAAVAATPEIAGTGLPPAAQAAWLRYEAAVEDLTRTLQARRQRLPQRTQRLLQRQLALVDRAILDARTALAADPEDPLLNRELNRTMHKKIALLRQVNDALVGAI